MGKPLEVSPLPILRLSRQKSYSAPLKKRSPTCNSWPGKPLATDSVEMKTSALCRQNSSTAWSYSSWATVSTRNSGNGRNMPSKPHHETRTEKSTNTWLTPKSIIDALGNFDLDPCHLPDGQRPYDTARKHYWEELDGLQQPWAGRVWLNPPFGNQQRPWVNKLTKHGNGILLLAARTEILAFHDVWKNADAVLFLSKRVQFLTPTGEAPLDKN